MMEEIVAIAAILLIIPGWAIGLVAITAYLWRLFYNARKWNKLTKIQTVSHYQKIFPIF